MLKPGGSGNRVLAVAVIKIMTENWGPLHTLLLLQCASRQKACLFCHIIQWYLQLQKKWNKAVASLQPPYEMCE